MHERDEEERNGRIRRGGGGTRNGRRWKGWDHESKKLGTINEIWRREKEILGYFGDINFYFYFWKFYGVLEKIVG